MKINGIELYFEMYDAESEALKNKYLEELDKMRSIEDNMPDGTEAQKNTYLCERIKGMFDVVFGNGTGNTVCGEGNNLLNCLDAYEQLVSEQMRQQKRYNEILRKMKSKTMKP